MTEIDYAARVAKGAAMLDEKHPGWERQIDLETLDIESPSRCVTAQVSGVNNYAAGQAQLGLDGGGYIAHGFNVSCDCGDHEAYDLPEDYDSSEAYDTLNTLWKDLISIRRHRNERQRLAAKSAES